MATLFTKIINGEIPCYKVAENEEFLAFLDIMPVKQGHVLVIPKIEVDYIFNLEDELLGRMMIFAKMVSKKIEKVFPCKRIGVTVIGLEVPHAHIHLIPIDKLDDMNFAKPKLKLDQQKLAQIAESIAQR
ncbi:MAG: HIT family protein [Crocinitomicaceae bacterium]